MLSSSNSPESDLLKSLLDPLLDDFEHWFIRSQTLLETETIDFLDVDSQAALLTRLAEVQQEVKVARTLLNLTDGQAGVETSVLMNWHQLVSECWQIAMRHRLKNFSKEDI
jgi:Protein of unknown function (DUF2605)